MSDVAKILLIEDDPGIVMTLRRVLTDEGYSVQVEKRGDKSWWMAIGAGWAHQDGGLSLKFNLVPVGGQGVVIRKAKPRADIATGEVLDEVPY